MSTIAKLLALAALCLSLMDCQLTFTYPVTITATGGGVTHTTVIYVTVVR